MAEFIYTIDGFSLTTTWKRQVAMTGASTYEAIGYDLASGSVTKTFDLSDLVLNEGESIKRVMLTATLNRVGTTDYAEAVTVNGLTFGTGSRKMAVSEFVPGGTWDARFYFCASGDAGAAVGVGQEYSYSCTMYYSDVTLTITTGTGSAFDGLVSSLPEGSKILIDEPDGAQGVYSIVHHGYGDETLCLLWRDNCLETTSSFNDNADTYLADNYGALDELLNTAFYEALPDTTKPFIQQAIYPTLDKRLYGTVTELSRYVCTPSVRELRETTGSEEWHGMSFDYLGTVDCDEIYWTRSVYTSSAGYAYRILADGTAQTYSRSYAQGVRPCFCVLENQLVTPGSDGTSYVLAAQVDAPVNLYLNDEAADLGGLQRDFSATLSWDAVVSPLVTGYEVWSSDTADGEYAMYNAVSAGEDGTVPTQLSVRTGSKGFQTVCFKVKAVTTPDTDYLDSALSDGNRSMATKRTNVHYYDGTRWLLAMPNHYSGSWKQTEGMKYFNGSTWVVPGT